MATQTLTRRNILCCGECGMPPEYCEYGPDFETNCKPWLKANHRETYDKLKELRSDVGETGEDQKVSHRPSAPWTTEERLTHFYETYQPDKVDGVGAILEKYAGKEDKLFTAMVKKYGPEVCSFYFHWIPFVLTITFDDNLCYDSQKILIMQIRMMMTRA